MNVIIILIIIKNERSIIKIIFEFIIKEITRNIILKALKIEINTKRIIIILILKL